MRIYINYETTDQPWGGINSFLRSFKEYIVSNKRGEVEVLEKPRADMDIFFFAASYAGPGKPIKVKDIEVLLKARGSFFNKISKKRKYKLIHRLDGLRASYNGEFIPNDDLQVKLSKLADFTIFQSKSSLESFRQFGYDQDRYNVIYNGVDQSIFNTQGKKFYQEGKLKILAVSWSNSLHKGFQTLADFSENSDIELYFVGRWNEEVDKKNVHIIPPKNREEIAELYKEMHVFLHPASNDFCPNVVLEAMSCGQPVIYHNSGGTAELASAYGIPLPTEINTETVAVTVQQVKKEYSGLIKKLLTDQEKFSITHVAEQYLSTFKKVLSNEQ